MSIDITVLGTPISQGSKNVSRSGHPYEQNDEKLRPWRQAVAQEAMLAMQMNIDKPFSGPVSVTISFYFRRPKGHYGTGRNEGNLKESAPTWKTTAPDVDKCIRSVLDGLTGVVIRDDSQVVLVNARKQYHSTPRAEIFVESMDCGRAGSGMAGSGTARSGEARSS